MAQIQWIECTKNERPIIGMEPMSNITLKIKIKKIINIIIFQ